MHRRQVKNNLLFLAVFTEFIVMEHVEHDRTTRDVCKPIQRKRHQVLYNYILWQYKDDIH